MRAFAPDSMVGLAFTQYPTPPHPDDPNYNEGADFKFDARRCELDLLTAYASPERFPNKRQGDYNTIVVSSEGRAFIVDNHTLEGEPAPSAELAWELLNQRPRLVCTQPRFDRDGLRGWRLATGPEARLLCHEYAGLPRPRRALDLGGHRAAMGLPASAIASSGHAPACRPMHAWHDHELF